MAKLGGEKKILEDIRTEFSTTPGGQVFDLNQGIQFYVKATGTSGITSIREMISQRVLTSSASPTFNDYGNNVNFPTRFSSTNGFTVPLEDQDYYPSYLKKEQTVAVFVGNVSDPSGVNIPRWSLASPNFWYDSGGSPTPKYPEDRINSLGSVSGSASGSFLLTNSILFTSASLTTGSHTVAVTPFLMTQRRVQMVNPTDTYVAQVIPVMTYRDWIIDNVKGLKLRCADIVACALSLKTDFDVPDINIESFSVGPGSGYPVYEKYFDRGRAERRLDPVTILGRGSPYERRMETAGWVSAGSPDEFHLVVFRQRIGSTESDDPGFMDMSLDGETCYRQRGFQNLPEGASRFTVEDALEASTPGIKTKPGHLRSLGAGPRALGLGNFSYCFAAGWDRILTDEEIKGLHDAIRNGAYTSSVTSTTAAVLSEGYDRLAIEHSIDHDMVNSQVWGTDRPKYARGEDSAKDNLGGGTLTAFVESSSPASGEVSIDIPIVTQDDPFNMGIAFRNHGDCKVGQTAFGSSRTNNRIKSIGSTNAIHGVDLYNRVRNIDGAFGPATIQIERVFTNNQGYSKPKTSGGNVGTGFLYYSPFKKSWIEKRPSHKTHRSNDSDYNYLILADDDSSIRDEISGSEAVLALEYNNDTPTSENNPGKLTFHITGANRILSQFGGSPNVGYFLPWKECLGFFNYNKIGWPTANFGAPGDSKYHAFDDETIKLDDYIDRPFILKSIELDIDIEASRMFVTQSATNQSGLGHQEAWARYVMNRRDIENYNFFIYRQRRKGRSGAFVRDSNLDISSSERFLIASASLSFYNSSSFGGSYKDQYWLSSSIFSSSLPTTFNKVEMITRALYYMSAAFDATSSMPYYPQVTTTFPVTRWTEPLHGPAFSYNWGVDFMTQSVEIMRSRVNLKMDPAITPYGLTSPTMFTFLGGKSGTYFTGSTYNTGTGELSGFRLVNGVAGVKRPGWFHTGVFADPFVNIASSPGSTHAGSGTFSYPMANFWYGSTRIPSVFVENSKLNRLETRNIVMFEGTTFNVTSSQDQKFGPYQNPKQSGLTVDDSYNYTAGVAPVFSQQVYYTPTRDSQLPDPQNLNLPNDGRAINSPNIVPGDDPPRDIFPDLPSILGTTDGTLQQISLKKLHRQGEVLIPPQNVKQITTEYLLLPGDELILGLENSNFGVSDLSPPPIMTGSYKDLVLDYLPFSYLRVLPGIGKIRLTGRYLRDDESYIPDKTFTGDITTVIGELPYDQFQVTETDGYYGGIFDEIITGSANLVTSPLRGVAGHATTGDIKGNFSINRFFTVYSERFVRDYYDDGLKDTLRTGTTSNQYQIKQKAVLSSIHYGYMRDFLETPPNQVLAPRQKGTPFNDSTVTVKFVEKTTTQFSDVNEFQKSQTSPVSIQGTNTTSQNVSRNYTLDGPYKDGEFTDRDAIEYTVTV